TPSFTSSFANTVPIAGHQFTHASPRYAKRKFISTSDFSFSEKFFHCSAENGFKSCSISPVRILSSLPENPCVSKIEINEAIDSAFFDLLLYQELKICRK